MCSCCLPLQSFRCQTLRAWECFCYACFAHLAPALLLTETSAGLASAVATTLPTPGGGPLAALTAAHGAALLQMSLELTAAKQRFRLDQSLPAMGALEDGRLSDQCAAARGALLRLGCYDCNAVYVDYLRISAVNSSSNFCC